MLVSRPKPQGTIVSYQNMWNKIHKTHRESWWVLQDGGMTPDSKRQLQSSPLKRGISSKVHPKGFHDQESEFLQVPKSFGSQKTSLTWIFFTIIILILCVFFGKKSHPWKCWNIFHMKKNNVFKGMMLSSGKHTFSTRLGLNTLMREASRGCWDGRMGFFGLIIFSGIFSQEPMVFFGYRKKYETIGGEGVFFSNACEGLYFIRFEV